VSDISGCLTSLGLTPQAVQRFQREAEAPARLHHTNIVPVHATGEEEGTHFYAMELIDGLSLDHVIGQMRKTRKGHQSREAMSEQGTAATPAPWLEATGPYVPVSDSRPILSASSLHSDSHYFDTVARMVAEVADAPSRSSLLLERPGLANGTIRITKHRDVRVQGAVDQAAWVVADHRGVGVRGGARAVWEVDESWLKRRQHPAALELLHLRPESPMRSDRYVAGPRGATRRIHRLTEAL
jgi:hypothetical protein